MGAPESDTPTFVELRRRHKVQTRLVRQQNRQIREAAERGRQMRAGLGSLPEPGVKAYVEILRRRSDLSLVDALALVSEVFTRY